MTISTVPEFRDTTGLLRSRTPILVRAPHGAVTHGAQRQCREHHCAYVRDPCARRSHRMGGRQDWAGVRPTRRSIRGLKPGDAIAARGTDELKAGPSVQVKQAMPA